MTTYLNVENWMLTAYSGAVQPIRRIFAKRVLVLDVVPSGEIPEGTNGVLCLKQNEIFSGEPVALDAEWVALESPLAGYRFTLSLNTEELVALFVGESPTVTLMADITITRPDEEPVATQKFEVVAERPVYRGDEQTPTPATSPTPVIQFIDDVPASKDDFYMFPGGAAPSSGMYQASDAHYNYTFKGGWTAWRRAAIALWCLAAACFLSGAQYDMPYVQRDGAGDNQERTVTLTPSTFLSVSANGTLQVQSSADFKSALALGISDVSGLQTALDARASLSGSYADPSWITTLAWSKITGKPTLGTAAATASSDYATAAQGALASTALQPGANGTNIKIGDGMTVSGAGSSAANGAYNVAGTSSARPYYQNAAGAQIYWYETTPPHHWAISHSGTSPQDLYRSNSDVPTPELATGWYRYSGGSDPAPSVSSSAVALPTYLNQKADASLLTSHTGNTSNPHATTKSQVGLGNVENTALSTWAGSGNITAIGTLASGAIPWSLVTGKPTLGTAAATDSSDYATAAQGALASSALQSGTAISNVSGLQGALDAKGALSGNNTWSGTNAFTGSVNFTLATDCIFPRVNIGTADFGWRYNPASGGQVEFVFPGGTAAFYQTGTPPHPYMYFAGTIQADYLVGSIAGITINASGLSGTIPSTVVDSSLSNMGNWLPWESKAGSSGVTYAADPDSMGNEPAAGDYYPIMRTVVVPAGTNYLDGKYRTATQIRGDLFPSASASLDFPSIAAGASSSLTITISGIVTTNTPTVSLGWSAALPAGIVVSHAWVSASNTVTVTLTNISGSAVDPAAVTCRASVTQY